MEPTFETVIGLEVHAQLKTRTKIFCGCLTDFGSPPNSQTCPVCLGHPGALPVLNREVVQLALRAAAALECDIATESVFARKNYFYPDLPKGYQISQYDRPLASGGRVPIELDGVAKEIGLIRIHLEEDAGKLLHPEPGDALRDSRVDLNRAGVPLIEIVSLPELRSPAEAYAFLQRLRSTLRYGDICDGNMEQGSFRCDANVSIRPQGQEALGTRTELKNLNSFRNVERALEHEIARQVDLVRSGNQVVQETVLWDAQAGETRPMRGKEEAHDYRYFPDPDLPVVTVQQAWIDEQRAALPELPEVKKRRLAATYNLTEYEAQLLTLEQPLADYYEQVAQQSGNPKAAANWILNDLQRELNQAKLAERDNPLPAAGLSRLIQMVDQGTVSVTVARQELFERMFRDQRDPDELVRELGLEQVSDQDELGALVDQVLKDHPKQLQQYRDGKDGLFGFFVGQVMRASGGKANPKTVRGLLEQRIKQNQQD